MKIGGILWSENVEKPSYLVKTFYDNNVKTVELVYNKKYSPSEVNKIKEFNIDFSVHCPFGLRYRNSPLNILLSNPKFYFDRFQIKEIEKGFNVAEKLNSTHFVLHGGVLPKGFFRFKKLRDKSACLKTFLNSFHEFFIKVKYSNVKVVLENLTFYNLFSEVSDIRYVQDKFPWLGFCFDFAHSEITDQTLFLKDIKIDHVHVSDNDFKNDLHLPIGEGKLNFDKLSNILESQKFKGKIIVECGDIKDIVLSISRIGKVF